MEGVIEEDFILGIGRGLDGEEIEFAGILDCLYAIVLVRKIF